MGYGALKSLVEMLAASTAMSGASVVYGEEFINAQDYPLPLVVVVPVGGIWKSPGYIQAITPNVNMTWSTEENIDLYLWAASTAVDAEPIDHADAVEVFRTQVLQAFQEQQAPYGLTYRPISGYWTRDQDAVNRFGRAYVLTVMVEIAVPDVLPVDATVIEVSTTTTITTG